LTLASFDDLTEAQLSSLPPDVLRYHLWQQRWLDTARPNQIPPDGDWTECAMAAQAIDPGFTAHIWREALSAGLLKGYPRSRKLQCTADRAGATSLAAWQYADLVRRRGTWTWMMGLRLGARPQVLWTTTPKPSSWCAA
jgi:hypothetical protein